MKLQDPKRILLLSIIDCMLLCIGHAYSIPIIVYSSLFLFIFITLKAQERYFFSIMLFFLPWKNLIRPSVDSISIYTIALIVAFLTRVLVFKRGKLIIKNSLTAVIIIVYTLTITIIRNQPIPLTGIMNLSMLILVPAMANICKNKICFEECALYTALGIILSGICVIIFKSYQGMIDFIKIDKTDVINAYRITGFTGDGNRYAAQTLTAVGFIMAVQMKEQGKYLKLHFLLIILLLICGILSVSKMFIFVAVLMLLVWLTEFLSQKGYSYRKILVFVGSIGAIWFIVGTGLLDDQIDIYIRRFSIATSFSKLTTNRTDIWNMYLSYIVKHVDVLIFGNGAFSKSLFYTFYSKEMNAHNVIIEMLYKYGVIGTILHVFWIFTIMKGLIIKKNSTLNWRPLLVVLIGIYASWMALPVMEFDEFFYLPVITAFALKYLELNPKVLIYN